MRHGLSVDRYTLTCASALPRIHAADVPASRWTSRSRNPADGAWWAAHLLSAATTRHATAIHADASAARPAVTAATSAARSPAKPVFVAAKAFTGGAIAGPLMASLPSAPVHRKPMHFELLPPELVRADQRHLGVATSASLAPLRACGSGSGSFPSLSPVPKPIPNRSILLALFPPARCRPKRAEPASAYLSLLAPVRDFKSDNQSEVVLRMS